MMRIHGVGMCKPNVLKVIEEKLPEVMFVDVPFIDENVAHCFEPKLCFHFKNLTFDGLLAWVKWDWNNLRRRRGFNHSSILWR
jgi:hypothetical protein